MAQLVCAGVWNGLPEGCSNGNVIKSAAGFLVFEKGQSSMTYSDFTTLATYTAKVIAKTMLPLHSVFSIEDASTDELREDSNIGRFKINHPGFRGYVVMFDYTLDEHEALKTFENKNIEIITIDIGGALIGTKDSTDGYVRGFGIDQFHVRKQPVSVPESGQKSVVEIQEYDPEEMDSAIYALPRRATAAADRWSPTDIKTISKINLTQSGAIAANSFVITASLDSTHWVKDGDLASSAATGGVIANLLVKDATGVEVTPTSVTETPGTQGEYTVVCTTFTAGTVQWVAQSSDEKLFESDPLTLS
jgi:hypothetical protein